MKTAISLPDDVFRDGERLARRLKTSRSRLYADAVREYVARHDPEEVTESYNRIADAEPDPADAAWLAASARRLTRVEW